MRVGNKFIDDTLNAVSSPDNLNLFGADAEDEEFADLHAHGFNRFTMRAISQRFWAAPGAPFRL
jgi:hypothetical protein